MIILHGNNQLVTRQRLNQQTNQFKGEVVRLNGQQVTLTQAKQALESASLFGQPRLIVIENFFARQTSQEKGALVEYFKNNQAANLILWEPKAIDGRRLASFKKSQVQKYEIPATIFKFLDSLGQGKAISVNLLHQTLVDQPAGLVFFMLCRRVGELIMAADLGPSGLTKMAPWQKSRLVNQARCFRQSRLITIYKKLLEIDWQQKTGQAAYSLTDTLDLLVASL